jgi:phosphocarrier protein FPr
MGAGRSAAAAWREACALQAGRLESLANELLAGRAADLRDVGRRVLRHLVGAPERPAAAYPAGTILFAEELTPSDAAGLDSARVAGFATVAGGATADVAILARAMGIPALAGCEPRLLDLPDGATANLDGAVGTLSLRPTEAALAAARTAAAAQAARIASDAAGAKEPARTRDGTLVHVLANAGSAADAAKAAANGAEGIGLLRSEFLFLDRQAPPTEEEQAAAWREVSDALGKGLPLTLRTLDVGGDKPLAYLPVAREENPFLGERGIRLSLDRPALFRAQLRSILAAAAGRKFEVMFPMVATPGGAQHV